LLTYKLSADALASPNFSGGRLTVDNVTVRPNDFFALSINGSSAPFTIATGCSIGKLCTLENHHTIAGDPSAVRVIDFFEARYRLQPGLYERGHKLEIKEKPRKLALHRLPSIKRADRIEESVYWLLSVAIVVYLLLGMIGR
jgi:hypothetical protein